MWKKGGGLDLINLFYGLPLHTVTHLADDVLDLCCDVVDAPDDDELVVRAGRHAQHRLPRPLRSRLNRGACTCDVRTEGEGGLGDIGQQK